MKQFFKYWYCILFKKGVLWSSVDPLNSDYKSEVIYIEKYTGQLKLYYQDQLFATRYVRVRGDDVVNFDCWECLTCYIINKHDERHEF